MTSMSAAEMTAMIQRAAAATVNAQAELAQERTRERAPKESRDLAESVQVAEGTPDDPTATVYTDSPYALYQHEALYLEHPNGGQAKFMESAVVGGDSLRRLEDAGARAALRVLG